MDDNGIAALAAAGDGRAFEELVARYEKKIYNLALRYTGNEQDALDVSQEVFLRVFRFLKGFKGESSFSTWIYRIAVNVCRDAAQKPQELSLDETDDEGGKIYDLPDGSFSPEEILRRRELGRSLADAISSLEEDHRTVVILRDVEGLSYEKIAETLGISSGTVKSRIARAREKLRKNLTESGNFFAGNGSKDTERR